MNTKIITAHSASLVALLIVALVPISKDSHAYIPDDSVSILPDIAIEDGVKTYTYILFTRDSYIVWLDVAMPSAGARSVIEAGCSDSSFVASLQEVSSYYNYSTWRFSGGQINPGESVTFWLRTPADVPTSYSWVVPESTNWFYIISYIGGGSEGRAGNSILPVPIPEPTSLLALGLAASGLGVGVLRRRRT